MSNATTLPYVLDDQSDSDDYSPVCSDIECDRSTQSVRVETGNLLNYMDNEEIEESTTTAGTFTYISLIRSTINLLQQH